MTVWVGDWRVDCSPYWLSTLRWSHWWPLSPSESRQHFRSTVRHWDVPLISVSSIHDGQEHLPVVHGRNTGNWANRNEWPNTQQRCERFAGGRWHVHSHHHAPTIAHQRLAPSARRRPRPPRWGRPFEQKEQEETCQTIANQRIDTQTAQLCQVSAHQSMCPSSSSSFKASAIGFCPFNLIELMWCQLIGLTLMIGTCSKSNQDYVAYIKDRRNDPGIHGMVALVPFPCSSRIPWFAFDVIPLSINALSMFGWGHTILLVVEDKGDPVTGVCLFVVPLISFTSALIMGSPSSWNCVYFRCERTSSIDEVDQESEQDCSSVSFRLSSPMTLWWTIIIGIRSSCHLKPVVVNVHWRVCAFHCPIWYINSVVQSTFSHGMALFN